MIKRRAARAELAATCMGSRRQPRTLRVAMCVRKSSGLSSRAANGQRLEALHSCSPNTFSTRRLALFPSDFKQTEKQSIRFFEFSRPEASEATLNIGSHDKTNLNQNNGLQNNSRYSDVYSLISVLEETNCTSNLNLTCNNPTDCDFLGSLLKYTHIL